MEEKQKNFQDVSLAEDGEKKIPYPKAVFFIIGNEFCERFSYYGMKTILTIYFITSLKYTENKATAVYHIFSMGCYFTPVFGAMIADSLLGKFRTIFYISIIYAIGNIVLAVGALPTLSSEEWIPLLGLALIAWGTGGIKPCVSAFGGDQFVPGQEKQLERFFSLFYMSINAGSLLSTFITPILRSQVHCFKQDTCFSLAFGVPAVLMVIALILFVIGKPLYRINPPQGNIIIEVLSCIKHALGRKMNSKEKKEHWLDFAADKYEKDFIADIKDVLHVLVLYLPLPIFWALFDQQGSRWTIQARNMDGEIGSYQFQPDQMQLANPFLILALVPTFSYVVYPLFAKCHLFQKPLQRIVGGGLLAAGAFIIAAFLELKLEASLPPRIEAGYSRVSLINTLPCQIQVQNNSFPPMNLQQYQIVSSNQVNVLEEHSFNVSTEKCKNVIHSQFSASYNFTNTEVSALLIGRTQEIVKMEDTYSKYENLTAAFRIVLRTDAELSIFDNRTFQIERQDKVKKFDFRIMLNETQGTGLSYTNLSSIDPGKYSVFFNGEQICKNDQFSLKNGGAYILIVTFNTDGKNNYCQMLTTVEPNTLSMFYQIPQYFVITMGEVMFSITGLEFSYSQAPSSMKSVLQAAWLLTVAFGNLIVVIVAEASFFRYQSTEFFMFAGLMIVDMLIFAVMAYFYKYVTPRSSLDEKPKEASKEQRNGFYQNSAFEEDTKM